jgi:hypothetical protein
MGLTGDNQLRERIIVTDYVLILVWFPAGLLGTLNHIRAGTDKCPFQHKYK